MKIAKSFTIEADINEYVDETRVKGGSVRLARASMSCSGAP